MSTGPLIPPLVILVVTLVALASTIEALVEKGLGWAVPLVGLGPLLGVLFIVLIVKRFTRRYL